MSANLSSGWGISISDLSHDFVQLEWNQPAPGARPDSYTLQYHFNGKWVTASTAADWVFRSTVKGLQPETTYQLRVLAHYGDSTAPSQSVQATTLRPFTAGIALTVPDSDPATIRVDWLEQEGATGYHVEWSWTPVVVGGSARMKIERAPWDGDFVAIHEEVPNAWKWKNSVLSEGPAFCVI